MNEGSGESDFEIATSAGLTVVFCVDTLLLLSGSASLLVTLTVLEIRPGAPGIATMVTVALRPVDSAPRGYR